MVKGLKLIGLSLLLYQSLCLAQACDNKGLDIDAGACSTKLYSGIPIARNVIEDSLNFASDLHKIDKKYGQEQEFSNFLENSKSKINDVKYANFAQECLNIFKDRDTEISKKIKVHILLEKVAQKYGELLETSEILKTREKESKAQQESTLNQTAVTDGFLDMFLNADKAIHTH